MFQSKAPAAPLQSSLPSGQASDGEPTSPVRSTFFFPTSPNSTVHGFWKRSSQRALTRSPQTPSPPYDDKNQTSRPSSPYRPVSPPPNASFPSLTIRNDTSPALSKRLPVLQQPSKSSATTMAVHGFSTPSFTKSASFSVIETKTIQKDYDPLTGHKVINEYIILRELGRGVHGKVKLAQDSEMRELVAIKIVDKHSRRRQLGLSRQVSNEAKTSGGYGTTGVANNIVATSSESKIRREIAILKKCVHRHVVRLKKVMDDENSKKIYMVLEYMEGGEIRWKDANDNPILSIEDARRIFRDVVCGLEYLHYQGIIHRDIKPANLLLTGDGIVKISDFGVSYFNEHLAGSTDSGDTQHHFLHRNPSENRIDRELAKTAGSPAFFAPELCYAGDLTVELKHSNSSQGSSPNITGGSASRKSSKSSLNLLDGTPQPTKRPRITKAIDIWAMGVTLYCFIFGRTPFIADTEFELFKLIPTKPVEFPWEIPDDLKDLILRLLDKDVENRITLEQVKRHRWTIADLPDYQKWIDETDPRKFKTVEITEEDMKSAVTMLDRLKKNLKKISEGLSHLTTGLMANRRRSKSISTTPTNRGFDKHFSHQSSKLVFTSSALTQSALRRSQSQFPPLVLPTVLPASGSLQNLVLSSPNATSQAISIARSPRGAGAHERFSGKLSVYSSSLPERGKTMYFQPQALRTSRALSVSEEEGTEDDDDAQRDLVADSALYGSSLSDEFAIGRNLNRSPHLANIENESVAIVTPLPKTSTNAGVSLRPKWLVGTDSYLSDDGPDEQQSAPASDHSSCQTGSSMGSEVNLASGKVENMRKFSTDRNTTVESENDEDYVGNKSYRR